MTISWRVTGALAIVVIGCDPSPRATDQVDSKIPASPESPAPAPSTSGSFAYVDSSGTRLLALDSVPDPSTIRGALCSKALALSVRYDRKQTRRSDDTGRQIASNFGSQRGDVFSVVRENAPPDKTCYLSQDSALLANARPATMREPVNCSPAQVTRLAAAKERQVIHCWEIAAAPTELRVLAVQFANIDTSALASLAVVGDTSLVFKDFPATHSDESTWRVDDEGMFSPSGFEILFVARLSYGYVMAITWAGAEGESSELMLSDSASAFRTLVKAYRYWSPA
jgi:hypothetical protein